MFIKTKLASISALITTLLFSSWSISASPQKPAQLFALDCGTHKTAGVLTLNANEHFILSINRSSFSPAELLVVGGDLDKKWELLYQFVEIEFYVPKPIAGTNGNNVVFLRSIKSIKSELAVPPPQLIKSQPCGLSEMFSN